MSPRAQYASFLIRVYRQGEMNGSASPPAWQSEIEHIQSGRRWKFDSLEKLSAFINTQIAVLEDVEWMEAQETGYII